MSDFTRIIYIRSVNLGKDTTFMLTFDSGKIPSLFKTVFPTAWKVAKFPKAGQYKFAATHKVPPFGVSVLQFIGGRIVSPPFAYTPIKALEQTSLLKKDNAYYFSIPTFSDSGISVKNKTIARENFGVGTFDHTLASPPSTLLVYKDVGAGSTIPIRVYPTIRGYVTSDLQQEGDILTGEVKYPVLFEQNVIDMDHVTYWKITYNPGSGTYMVQREHHGEEGD